MFIHDPDASSACTLTPRRGPPSLGGENSMSSSAPSVAATLGRVARSPVVGSASRSSISTSVSSIACSGALEPSTRIGRYRKCSSAVGTERSVQSWRNPSMTIGPVCPPADITPRLRPPPPQPVSGTPVRQRTRPIARHDRRGLSVMVRVLCSSEGQSASPAADITPRGRSPATPPRSCRRPPGRRAASVGIGSAVPASAHRAGRLGAGPTGSRPPAGPWRRSWTRS